MESLRRLAPTVDRSIAEPNAATKSQIVTAER